jgi:hypothetical protein
MTWFGFWMGVIGGCSYEVLGFGREVRGERLGFVCAEFLYAQTPQLVVKLLWRKGNRVLLIDYLLIEKYPQRGEKSCFATVIMLMFLVG